MKHHIVFGDNELEKSIYQKIRRKHHKDQVLYINKEDDLNSVLGIIKFKPFFYPHWFLVVNVDRISFEGFKKLLPEINKGRCLLYIKIVRNRNIWTLLNKTPSVRQHKKIVRINCQFPSDEFVYAMIKERTYKTFSKEALKQLTEHIRFNLNDIEEIMEKVNGVAETDLSVIQLNKIFPNSRNRRLKDLCFMILLNNSHLLKANWQKYQDLAKYANKKDKPYTYLDSLDIDALYCYNTLTKIFRELVIVKELYMQGLLTETLVFDNKDNLTVLSPKLKGLSVRAVNEYLYISQVTPINDMRYILMEFQSLKSNKEITYDDIYFCVYKCLNRHTLIDTSKYNKKK